jgi:hypothetical protein
MRLLPERERVLRKADHTQGRETRGGTAIFLADRDPHFKRVLCSDVVEPQGGEQTDDSAWHALRRFGDRVEFSDGSISGRIESAAGTDNETLLFSEPQILARNAVRVEISGTENTRGFGEFRNSGKRLHRLHALILRNVGTY